MSTNSINYNWFVIVCDPYNCQLKDIIDIVTSYLSWGKCNELYNQFYSKLIIHLVINGSQMALYCVAFNPTMDKTLDNSFIMGINGSSIEDVISQFVNLSLQNPKELMLGVCSFLIQVIEHVQRELNPVAGDWFYDCCPELSIIRSNQEAMSALKSVQVDIIKNNIIDLIQDDINSEDISVKTHFMEHQVNYALILSLAYNATFVRENFTIYPLQIFGRTVTKSAKSISLK
jgi:hypothetical protein